jgi:anti-sigma regulatory factor (Ser/Thr protein kinase)
MGAIQQPMDLQFDLAPQVSAPSQGRQALGPLRSRLGGDVFDRLRLLTSELIANSVQHGRLQPEDQIHVRVSFHHEKVHVDVVDEGQMWLPPEVPVEAPMHSEDGRGLFLLDRLADAWGVDPGPPTRIWFELAAPGARRDRGATEALKPTKASI